MYQQSLSPPRITTQSRITYFSQLKGLSLEPFSISYSKGFKYNDFFGNLLVWCPSTSNSWNGFFKPSFFKGLRAISGVFFPLPNHHPTSRGMHRPDIKGNFFASIGSQIFAHHTPNPAYADRCPALLLGFPNIDKPRRLP
jgi:hypothetical protein